MSRPIKRHEIEQPDPTLRVLPSADNEIDTLLAKFQVRDEPAVRAFLAEHPGQAPIVEEARAAIDRIFGADSAGLMLWVDDSVYGEPPRLWIGILTAMPSRPSINRLHELDHAWYGSSNDPLREHLMTTLV